MTRDENYEVTCEDCGSTFRGATVYQLDRDRRHQRVGGEVVQMARCLCADREAARKMLVVVDRDPTVFIVRSRAAYSMATFLMRAVRATDATVFALPVDWNSKEELRFSVERARSSEYSTTPEELQQAVRGLLAAQKSAAAKKPARSKP